MALSEKERMMLYLLLAIIGVLVVVWFIRDVRRHHRPSRHLPAMPVLSDQQKMALRSLGIKDLSELRNLGQKDLAYLRSLGIKDIDKLKSLAEKNLPALRNLGMKDIAALKAKYCPVCQDQSGECNCPPQADCPAPRPTAQDAQALCAGQDITQGVPYTADCINAIFSVYGCNVPYPDPNTPQDQILFNVNPQYSYYTLQNINDVARQYATWGDDVHRNECYGQGGVPLSEIPLQ
jgi:hypothetical protein